VNRVSTHRTRTVKAVLWSGLTSFSRAPISVLTNVVLYRVLGPSVIGLMAMLTTVTDFLEFICELGLGAGIVRTRDITARQINDLFILNFLVSLVLSVLLFLGAPVLAAFFREPLLADFYRLLAVVPILRTFSFTSHAILTRNLEFKKIAYATWVPNVGGSGVTILLVFTVGGLQALVLGFIFTVVLRTAMLLAMARWRPAPAPLSYRRIRPILGFSIYVYLEKLANYFTRNLDRIFIGRFLGAEAFGLYEAAKRMIAYLHGNLSRTIARVAFPALSVVQDDLGRLRRGYLEVARYMSLVTFPALTGMILISGDLFPFLFGEAWNPSVRVFQILCGVAVIHSVWTLGGSAFYSLGKSRISFAFGLLHTGLLAIVYLVAWRFGILGIAAGVAVGTLLVFPAAQGKLNRILDLRTGELLEALRTPILGCLLMALVVTPVRLLLAGILPTASLEALIVTVTLGAGTYLLFLRLHDPTLLSSCRELIGLLREPDGSEVEPDLRNPSTRE
jgi:lipopolysaccharide exporter